MFSRRKFLSRSLWAASFCALRTPVAFATVPSEKRLLIGILRGGLDGISAIPPHGDRSYRSIRGELALDRPGTPNGIIDLDGMFGLHPALGVLRESFNKGEFAPVVAVASPHRERSHFDAQNILECGGTRAYDIPSGWLNRAISILGPAPHQPTAFSRTIPLLLRGPAPTTATDPTHNAQTGASYLESVAALYAGQPLFETPLQDGIAAQAMLKDTQNPNQKGMRSVSPLGRTEAQETTRAIAGMMRQDKGPRIGVMEYGGWDTHSRQEGTLNLRLSALAESLKTFEEEMGDQWQHTVVVLVTEFGRTVQPNGTGGTDHGTASVAMLMGGAVKGGTVYGSWPGLAVNQLYEGRDVRPTTDIRALFKGVLHGHFGMSRSELDQEVFPNSQDIAPLTGIIRS